MSIICRLLQIYVLVLIARAIASWFPVTPGSAGAQIVGVLHSATEPVLGPARRIIPPIGMFDISMIVVIFGIQILMRAICG